MADLTFLGGISSLAKVENVKSEEEEEEDDELISLIGSWLALEVLVVLDLVIIEWMNDENGDGEIID